MKIFALTSAILFSLSTNADPCTKLTKINHCNNVNDWHITKNEQKNCQEYYMVIGDKAVICQQNESTHDHDCSARSGSDRQYCEL